MNSYRTLRLSQIILGIALALALSFIGPTAVLADPIRDGRDCLTETLHPSIHFDTRWLDGFPADGINPVPWEQIHVQDAVEACDRAHSSNRGNRVIQFHYARALHAMVVFFEVNPRGGDAMLMCSLYRLAFENNYWQAAYNIGVAIEHDGLCDHLTGVNTDALTWYERAAEQGHSGAALALGEAHYYGEGRPRNFTIAARYLEIGAQAGNSSAQNLLGIMYRYGEGVPIDYQRAAALYLAAARQGLDTAQFNIGLAYFNGQGVAQDRGLAGYWWEQAARQGNSAAAENLSILRRGGGSSSSSNSDPALEEFLCRQYGQC